MFNSIYKRVLVLRRVPCPSQNVLFIPFSSSTAPKFISETSIDSKDPNSIMNYLVSRFGFSQEKAYVASKYLRINSPDKLESVSEFLKNRGFTADQIGSIVRHLPLILMYDPQNNFMPKIEFFQSSGISPTEVNNMILTGPCVLTRSLENHIIPTFNYIKSLFGSNGSSLSFTKRLAEVFVCSLESHLIPNIEILRDAGVPDSRIMVLLQRYPRTLMVRTEKFKEVVNEVKQMKFSPCKSTFLLAVHAIRGVSNLNWEKKVSAYKKWGLSEDDIRLAFHKQPCFMQHSVDKITSVMDFLINEMGLDSSFVVERPTIVGHSLEKRLKPRGSVYKILVDNGLIKKGYALSSIFHITEKDFLNKFVHPYENEVPELLECYQKFLAVSKKSRVC